MHRLVLVAFLIAPAACSKDPPPLPAPPSDEPPPKAKPVATLHAVHADSVQTPPPPAPSAATFASGVAPASDGKIHHVANLMNTPSAAWSPWVVPILQNLPLPTTLPSALPTALGIPWFLPAPTAAPSQGKHVPVVLLYGAHWCSHCEEAEAHMKQRAIAYTYRNVDDPGVNQELGLKLQAAGYKESSIAIPVIEIDGDLQIGWSAQKFDEEYDAKAK